MDDILAKKNRHLFLEEKDNQNNSFIRNINYAVENIDTIKTFNDNVNSGTMQHLLETYIEQVGTEGNAWVLKLTELGESILATTSGFNYAAVLTVNQNIEAGAAITLPEAMKYRVGTHMLLVSWNGTVCYNGEQYEEIGAFNEKSTVVKIKQDIKTGDKLEFRTVALADTASVNLALRDAITSYTFPVNNSNTERTLKERFSDIINVKDFGAKGDGVTDDTLAFQAALDVSATAASNGVSIPVYAPGIYKISSPLVIWGGANQEIHVCAIVVDRDAWTGGSWSESTGTYTAGTWDGSGRNDSVNWNTKLNRYSGQSWYASLSPKNAVPPAVWVRAQRCDLYFSFIDCGEVCPGIYIDTTGSVLKNGTFVTHFKAYGITWAPSTNCLLVNPNLQQYDITDVNYALRDAPGLLVQGWDSKVLGGHIGRCNPAIEFTSTSVNNIFVGLHAWAGDDGKGISALHDDPVLIIDDGGNNNMMYDCYFDSGHIDMYGTLKGLHIFGGCFLANSSICSITGGAFRFFAAASNELPYLARIEDVAGATFEFKTHDGKSFEGDYSTINGLISATGASSYQNGYRAKVYRANMHIIPRTTNGASDFFYKPANQIVSEYWVGQKALTVSRHYDVVRLSCSDSTLTTKFFLGAAGTYAGMSSTASAESGALALWGGGSAEVYLSSSALYPVEDNDISLGKGAKRWTEVFAATGVINTSDERVKDSIEAPSDALMRAWGKVGFKVFQFKDAVKAKGKDAARLHVGVIAQQVIEAFASEGLDASRYGLLCHDSWEARDAVTTTEIVVEQQEELNPDGTVKTPERTRTETIVVEPAIEAGDIYSIRYEEALALECAYQRWLGEQRDAKIEALMQRISALENNQ